MATDLKHRRLGAHTLVTPLTAEARAWCAWHLDGARRWSAAYIIEARHRGLALGKLAVSGLAVRHG